MILIATLDVVVSPEPETPAERRVTIRRAHMAYIPNDEAENVHTVSPREASDLLLRMALQ